MAYYNRLQFSFAQYLDLGRQYNEEIEHLQKIVADKTAISREEWLELVAQMKVCSPATNN